MASEHAIPPPSRGADSGRPAVGTRGQQDGHGERYGPVTISRLAKEDGRALLLYSHEERQTPEERERT